MFKLVTNQTLYNSVLILTGYITAVPFFLFFFLPYRKLPDDPKAEWSVSLVSSEILKHIRAHSINMVRPTLCLVRAFQRSGFCVISCTVSPHNFPAIIC